MLRYKNWLLAVSVLILAAQYTLGTAQSPTATPSGSADKILFESTGDTGWELFTVNADGTGLTQLTRLGNLIPGFIWSPDGQYIAFTTFPPGFSLTLELNVMNADGSEIQQLNQKISRGMAWSPDSQQIAFVAKQDGLGEIYLVNRDGSGERRLTHGRTDVYLNDVYDLSWSPDGQQIAFIRPYQLYVVNVDDSGEKALTLVMNAATAVDWSPNGEYIAFVMTVNQQSGIYTALPDGSDSQRILQIPSDYTGLDWSPDGQHLAYTQKNDGVVSLFIVDADGQNNHQLADDIVGASWSPDSKQIVYAGNDASHLRATLYIIDFDGQNQTVLPGNNTFDHSPLWSPAQSPTP